VRAAVDVFVARVVKPAMRTPAGISRVWAMFESWLRYVQKPVFSEVISARSTGSAEMTAA
jgi:hypothetical protein